MIRFIKRWMPARDEVRKPMKFARQSVAMLRREYQGKPLEEKSVSPNPIQQFELWFEEAAGIIRDDPNAMVLSTADDNGRPSARTVLMKGFDDDGIVFYTNYESRKSLQIMKNPHVALTFQWPDLVRQVCIEGVAEKVPESQSDAYFRSRPVSSRISAVASPQSKVLVSRSELEKRVEEVRRELEGEEISRPDTWGGYLVRPERFEFWQGRINRLHDRLEYLPAGNGRWTIRRLAP
ncbi:pyridoxamine 5'-phosphate oxidase [Balneolales bacterium ANBcel1]|nr:pyridoxamine 5'-phosphate oxidase [Balneolales bacterium ANBcel1]